MLLLIDNYDSFTYNLYQYLCELGQEVEVFRNDKLTVEDVDQMAPERTVVSPGPCTPKDAGISVETIKRFAGKLPILGVCLGHQCIGEAYGATVTGAGGIKRGKMSQIRHDGKGVFEGLPTPFEAVRYHSLAIVPDTLPPQLEATAWSESGVMMGVRHKEITLEGVQFHRSILTSPARDLLATSSNDKNISVSCWRYS